MSELLLVMGLLAVFVGLTAAISNTSINNSEFDRVLDSVRGEVFAAQADTIAGTLDSAWGVKFESNRIIRYKGDSYTGREEVYDLISEFDNAVRISGSDEVAYTRPFGTPVLPVQVIIEDDVRQSILTINHLGAIEIN